MGALDLVARIDPNAANDPRWPDWAFIAAAAEEEARVERMKRRQG